VRWLRAAPQQRGERMTGYVREVSFALPVFPLAMRLQRTTFLSHTATVTVPGAAYPAEEGGTYPQAHPDPCRVRGHAHRRRRTHTQRSTRDRRPCLTPRLREVRRPVLGDALSGMVRIPVEPTGGRLRQLRAPSVHSEHMELDAVCAPGHLRPVVERAGRSMAGQAVRRMVTLDVSAAVTL
jgi:hypothetical protein